MSEPVRWSLNSAHYLKVAQLPDGTKVEWEHKETARETGRNNAVQFGYDGATSIWGLFPGDYHSNNPYQNYNAIQEWNAGN